MTNKEKLDKIKAHIKKNYEPEDGAATSLHSEGNYDDVFSDGFDRGMCIALWELVEILGLDFPEPHEQNFDKSLVFCYNTLAVSRRTEPF